MKPDGRFGSILLTIFIATFLIVSVMWYIDSKTNCDRRGGELVRGTWGYACVAAPSNN